ncbi:FG-GAP-like repeat-containing protein [Planctomycetes bacterium K23_9]|uniref:FG-GAP repeat protein n=1 Tax=Stieleria marina TaxID=1930275 RepID=A0A517P0X0_9BACT|nr:FG-GAP repeat protein [Planctomycetes bacterium K23_9]
MTEQGKLAKSAGSTQKWWLLAFVVLGAIAAIAFWRPRNGGEGPGAVPVAAEADELEQHLGQLRSALAATENLETDAANQLWDSLGSQFPDDQSIALNRALNRVLDVDSLSGVVISPLSSDDEKQRARVNLSPSITSARQAIEQYTKLANDEITGLWLSSRIDLHSAALVPALGKSMRRDVFASLVKMIDSEASDDSASVILGGPLTRVIDEMEDPVDGLPRAMLGQANSAVGKLSDKHPANLFLAIRAARLAIDAQDHKATQYVQRTFELAKAIEPSLQETTKAIGITPEQLVGEITSAINDDNWDAAGNRMLQWFNVLNPTEILKTDRRRASPHPLDRLSFQTLRRMSADVIKQSPVKQGDSEIQFAVTSVEPAKDIVEALPIDFDLDQKDDIATISDSGKLQLWQNDGEAWAVAADLQLDASAEHLMVADLFMVDSSSPQRIKTSGDTGKTADRDYSSEAAHDTFPSLIAFGNDSIQLISVDGRSSASPGDVLKLVDKKSGLEEVRGVIDMVTGDLEGDGDLDVVISTKSDGIRLFVNRGNRTFFEVTHHEGGFDSADPAADMALVDIDRDLDLDIVTVHPKSGRTGILENQLHLQFRGRMIDDISPVKGASSVAIADLDGNVSWDILVGGNESLSAVFSQTAEAGIWTVEQVQSSELNAAAIAIADLDNDSWSEAILPGVLMRLGPWGIGPAMSEDFLPGAVGRVSAADINRDGRVDLVIASDGNLVVATNQTKNENHHLTVRFKGIADNNASSGRVNHFGIGSVLELRFGPHYRSHVVTSPATHFGLDRFDDASSVRVIMPNGLTQTIRDPQVDALVQEKQTLKGSCPYLYAWDGEKYAFVTDCLWAAPLGLQVAAGVVAKDRPWEYLKVDGSAIVPKDGRYQLRFTEELWEVAYFDHLALTAVDHPRDVDVWTNEKVGPPDLAKQTIFAFGSEDRHGLRKAVDSQGHDVTDLLSQRDQKFVRGFDRRLRQGLCPPHWVDLDFEDVHFEKLESDDDSKESVYLVLTGWILPTDTSLNIQIDQNPNLPAIEFPSVWVPDATETEGWRKAIPFMGFPGGKTKTIVVDVTDVIVRDDPRIRVRTSAQIYWDDAALVVQSTKPKVVTHQLDLISAEVGYHGFSRRVKRSENEPDVYDYRNASKSPKWPPLRGAVTQFGPCKDLLSGWDNSMVVISSGDEIRVDFLVPTTPVPEGWQRDFVLHCVGWDKDADLNTLEGQTIGPLPFRQMQSYPPPLGDAAKSAKIERDNLSHRQRRQSFRSFWSRTAQTTQESELSRQFRTPSFDEIQSP